MGTPITMDNLMDHLNAGEAQRELDQFVQLGNVSLPAGQLVHVREDCRTLAESPRTQEVVIV